ncbi:MAG: hypothetical protein ACTSO4_10805 [Promethearchaeota archaeon]
MRNFKQTFLCIFFIGMIYLIISLVSSLSINLEHKYPDMNFLPIDGFSLFIIFFFIIIFSIAISHGQGSERRKNLSNKLTNEDEILTNKNLVQNPYRKIRVVSNPPENNVISQVIKQDNLEPWEIKKRFCPYCGNSIANDAKYCNFCNTKLN